IHILGGYKMERIQEHFRGTDVRFIYNSHFDTMNNIYSFLLTESIGDDLLLINSDDFYDDRMIPLLLNHDAPSASLVDRQNKLTEEAMSVTLENGRLRERSKKKSSHKADGEYIEISKLAMRD